MGRQLINFTLIGISSSAVNWGVFNGTLFLLQAMDLAGSWDFVPALALGFLISVLWSFLLNRRFVFQSPEERAVPWLRALVKTYLSYSFTGIVLGFLLSLLWLRVLGIPKQLATILNDFVSFPVSFLLNKFWAFSPGTSKKP